MLDEKDLKIIEFLRENSRISYTELAEKIGISDVAVIKRIRKLERKGIIKKYTIIVDPKKLGFKLIAIVGIDVDPEHIFTVISYLRDKEFIKYLSLSSGDHTIMAEVWAKDSGELSMINKEISELTGVKRVCPSIILEVIKD